MEILFVENHCMDVFNPQFGAAQRSNLLLNACAQVGHVDVIMFSDLGVQSSIRNCDILYQKDTFESDSLCKIRCRKLKYLLFDNYEVFMRIDHEKQKVVDSIVSKKNYDYIVVRYIPDAINCGLMKYAEKLIIDMDDNPISVKSRLNKKYFETGHRSMWNRFMRRHEIESQRRLLSRMQKNVRCIFASNLDDVKAGFCYLPNIPFWEIESTVCPFEKSTPSLLFVGIIDYEPNFNGITHFLEHIFPLIKMAIPKVTISIVGRADQCDVSKWIDDNHIKFKGFVEDLNAEYEQSRVAVVPCYDGAGTNIKVLEAMRQKRPCVTTKMGARGYESLFKDKVHYLISNSDEEFAENVIHMLTDENANHRISENASFSVKECFSRAAFNNVVIKVLQSGD